MNYREFSVLLDGGWYDKVKASCHIEGCTRIEELTKGSALRNFNKNGKFLCRSCSFTDIGKEKIAAATRYKRSDDTKKKMSESANKKWETEWGKEHKKKLSMLAAEQVGKQKPEKFRIKGLYKSCKSEELVVYTSSYELRRCWMLDKDDNVKTYKTQVSYQDDSGNGRSLDFLIEYQDGTIKAEEVKPIKRINEEQHKLQLDESRKNAERKGWQFSITTEETLGMKEKELKQWALEYRKINDRIDLDEYYQKKRQATVKKHNDKVKVEKAITFFCEFCKEYHTRSKWSYDGNIKKNGRFICIKENGSIIGKKPKS